MIILIKLILAHLIGDFLLQPKLWVEEKEKSKAKSIYLYAHILVHGLLIVLLLGNLNYWLLALLIMVLHGIIDTIKVYAIRDTTKAQWFFIDQGLHAMSIVLIWFLIFEPEINIHPIISSPIIWIYATAILLLTVVSGIVMRELMSTWSKALDDINEESLNNAGKYIGMLERLFVFVFVIIGNWEGIGFLLAAKSVFRFGDLRESKDRKLTEYILIGTLLSFGIAIAIGILALKLIQLV